MPPATAPFRPAGQSDVANPATDLIHGYPITQEDWLQFEIVRFGGTPTVTTEEQFIAGAKSTVVRGCEVLEEPPKETIAVALRGDACDVMFDFI